MKNILSQDDFLNESIQGFGNIGNKDFQKIYNLSRKISYWKPLEIIMLKRFGPLKIDNIYQMCATPDNLSIGTYAWHGSGLQIYEFDENDKNPIENIDFKFLMKMKLVSKSYVLNKNRKTIEQLIVDVKNNTCYHDKHKIDHNLDNNEIFKLLQFFTINEYNISNNQIGYYWKDEPDTLFIVYSDKYKHKKDYWETITREKINKYQ